MAGLLARMVRKYASSVRGTSTGGGGLLGPVRESYAGAWQRNVEVESKENILAFSAVYACITRIADDISKLRLRLVERTADGIWVEVERTNPFAPVLRKPNRYQTRIQFFAAWVVQKLLHGNAFVLKEFDARGVVVRMHVLDSRCVTILVAPDGAVFYQLQRDDLAHVGSSLPTVPADYIIHDRAITLWHPLLGVSPIYACGAASTQGIRIQANSAKFFENMSRPSGHLTAPQAISDDAAARIKRHFEENFSGANIGRLLVTGDGLKYEPMTIPPHDAQLIEQLEWTVRDVARCFHVPLYKIAAGGNAPTGGNLGALNDEYYTQTLQTLIESIELLLDEGLGLVAVAGKEYGTEFDLDGLLRMDAGARAEANMKAIGAGYLSPNEARARENLPPVDGGESPYLQQQNYSLAALAERDSEDPFPAPSPPPPAPPPPPPQLAAADAEDDEDGATERLLLAVTRKFAEAEHA